MNKYVDIRSFIIGILITICIVLVMGAGLSSSTMPCGRFQLVIREGITSRPGTEFVIDTSTGQVWHSPDNRDIFLAPKIQIEKTKTQQGSTIEK